MKRRVALVALGLACASCGLIGGPPATPEYPATQVANPLAEGLTAAALTPTYPATAATAAADAAPLHLPTPVTTFTTATTSEVFGAVTVVTMANTTRYTLLGQTAGELDAYMRGLGPLDSTGNRWFALTEPKFDWGYPCTCDDGGCVTGPVTVYVTLDYTIPIWEPPAGSDPTLVEQWKLFERAVVLHERGHGQLASACGRQLGEAFVALAPQPSCAAVGSAVRAASEPVFAECQAAQRQYEDETDHGQGDGVLWPP